MVSQAHNMCKLKLRLDPIGCKSSFFYVDLNGNSPLYLESLVFDEKTQKLFLTSGKAGSIFTLSTHHSSMLEQYLSSSELSPSGIAIDLCSR